MKYMVKIENGLSVRHFSFMTALDAIAFIDDIKKDKKEKYSVFTFFIDR